MSSGSGSPSRKVSNTSVESITSPTPGSTPFQRSHSRNSNNGSARKSFSGTKSLGRSSGISFLKSVNHTVETQDTHFIRAATGRGSIKRGPAPTKSSILVRNIPKDQILAVLFSHLAYIQLFLNKYFATSRSSTCYDLWHLLFE